MSWNVAGRVLDIYDDASMTEIVHSPNLHKLGSIPILTAGELNALPNSQFALVFRTKTGSSVRKYPINDEGQAELSIYYAGRKLASLPEPVQKVAATNLARAADGYSLELPAKLRKLASDKIDGNEVSLQELEALEAQFTASDIRADLLKIACTFARDHFAVMTGQDRKKTASTLAPLIEKRWPALGSPQEWAPYREGAIQKEASEIRVALAERKGLVDPLGATILDKMWESRSHLPGEKLAEALNLFDQKYHLDRFYRAGLPDAWQATLTTPKEASLKVGSVVLQESDVHRLGERKDILDRFFSEADVKEFQSSPVEVFQSLPAPTQSMLIGELTSEE